MGALSESGASRGRSQRPDSPTSLQLSRLTGVVVSSELGCRVYSEVRVDVYDSRSDPPSFQVDHLDALPLGLGQGRQKGVRLLTDGVDQTVPEQDRSMLNDLVSVLKACPDGTVNEDDVLGARDEAIVGLSVLGRELGSESNGLVELSAPTESLGDESGDGSWKPAESSRLDIRGDEEERKEMKPADSLLELGSRVGGQEGVGVLRRRVTHGRKGPLACVLDDREDLEEDLGRGGVLDQWGVVRADSCGPSRLQRRKRRT